MITTLRELLEKNRLELNDTVYKETPDEILDFPLTVGDFFEVKEGLEKGKNFHPILCFSEELERKCREAGTAELAAELKRLESLASSVKINCRGEYRRALLEELREKKRPLKKEIESVYEACYQALCVRWNMDPETLRFLEYKNRVMVTDFANLSAQIPCFLKVRQEGMQKIPWLTSDLSLLKQALEKKQPVGLVGGPCLFGIDEVILHLYEADGNEKLFDLSCTRRCKREPGDEAVQLHDYLREKGTQIRDLRIENRKTGLTRQEVLSLVYLLEAAHVLRGKTVIPLPDLSYMKYVESSLDCLPEPYHSRLTDEFRQQAFCITDLYLDVIDRLKGFYPELEVKVLHLRDRELCRLFYEKREPYIKGSSYLKKITGADKKKESIIDYITMLALPYYFFGTRDVIQLDSLDETDSGRKCQKIHKGDFTLHSILYPEFLSADGINTLYHTDLAHKEYIAKDCIAKNCIAKNCIVKD